MTVQQFEATIHRTNRQKIQSMHSIIRLNIKVLVPTSIHLVVLLSLSYAYLSKAMLGEAVQSSDVDDWPSPETARVDVQQERRTSRCLTRVQEFSS